jgi:hypothetical protein
MPGKCVDEIVPLAEDVGWPRGCVSGEADRVTPLSVVVAAAFKLALDGRN